MDLFTNLSDDQLALLGCFAALVVSAAIMCLSFYAGPASKVQQASLKLPHIERLRKQSAPQSDRKAA